MDHGGGVRSVRTLHFPSLPYYSHRSDLAAGRRRRSADGNTTTQNDTQICQRQDPEEGAERSGQSGQEHEA